MFLFIDGVQFPKKFLHRVCSNNGKKIFYYMAEHLIPLGETEWPKPVKHKVEKMFKDIGIEQPLKQKLVEPSAWAFGGRKDASSDYNFDEVDWEYVVDYFRWEALSISEDDNDHEHHLTSKELQEKALKKYGSKFLHYLVYANPKHMKEVAPNMWRTS